MEETRNAPHCDREDKISRLPDTIIHYILSFNDTKYAVQTCALSKRWVHVWKSLPSLCFNRNSFPVDKKNSFTMFVDLVFIFRRKDIDIQKFSLDWEDSGFDNTVVTNVNRWCLHAIEYNVQEITIMIEQSHRSPYEIPHRLLNCKSLRKLEIQVFHTAGYIVDVVLPRSMNLPQLEELSIDGLWVSNLELSKRFFSSCPVLETLDISGCDNRRNVIVDSLSLKKFIYNSCWLQNDTMTTTIKLCAPNLKSFVWRFYVTRDCSLEICSPPSSVRFRMTLRENEEDENAEAYEKLPSTEIDVYAKRMMKFLGAFHLVKDMWLSPGFLEVLSRAPDLLDCQPPRLCNLHSLVLEMWPTRGCLRAIAYLLSISPNIASVFLGLKESIFSDIGDDWEAGLSLPEMLPHLRYVEFRDAEGPEGCDAEFKLVSFLLKSAKSLEKVCVTFRSSVSSRDRMRQVKRYRKKLDAGGTGIQWS